MDRMRAHDDEQASRWTDAQKIKVVEIIEANPGDFMWHYKDVPPEGGNVELGYGRKEYVVYPDGTVSLFMDNKP